jgi:hypothetical protein
MPPITDEGGDRAASGRRGAQCGNGDSGANGSSRGKGAEIASLLHVTNSFAMEEGDFDKGEAAVSLRVIVCCSSAFRETLGG